MFRCPSLRSPIRLTCCRLAAALLSLLIVAFLSGNVRAAGKRGVLVLTNGRVLGGQLDTNAGGYLVSSPNGSVLVPFEKVQLKARNLRDAYRRLLASFPNPSPATHVALANWCMTQQMYDEAKIELRSALKFDPNHAEARNMLRRLDEILAPPSATVSNNSTERRKTSDGFDAPPAVSLAGMPRESAMQFVTKIQPLMMNSCALAGCHTTGEENRFSLTRVRIGARSSRSHTEQNLAAVLQYIDYKDGDASLLLSKPRGNHGRGGRPVFAGIRGNDQFNLLRDWTREVAASKTVAEAARTGVNGSAESPLTRSNFTLQENKRDTEIDERIADLRDGTSRKPADRSLEPSTRSDIRRTADERPENREALLDSVRRDDRRDAFDPREFNLESTRLAPR